MICTYREDEWEHVSTGPTCPGLLGFPCLCTLHAQEPSMSVLQQTCAHISTLIQTLTLSTVPPSPRGEETLDQGNSSHRQVQVDELFRRLLASPLMPTHHSQALQSCSTMTSYMDPVCTTDLVGKMCPRYYRQDSPSSRKASIRSGCHCACHLKQGSYCPSSSYCLSQLATKNHVAVCSLLPPPCGMRQRIGKKGKTL